MRQRDGKTYYVMVDAKAFQEGVGRLLAEVQRIKAEGDYEAAKALFETYGVHFDPALRDEIVARVDHLNMPSYTGFVQPRLEPVTAPDGTITDVHDLVSAGSDDADAGVLGQDGSESGLGIVGTRDADSARCARRRGIRARFADCCARARPPRSGMWAPASGQGRGEAV